MLWDRDPKYPARSLAVVAAMAKRFSSFQALLGFNLLDSPVVCRCAWMHFTCLIFGADPRSGETLLPAACMNINAHGPADAPLLESMFCPQCR